MTGRPDSWMPMYWRDYIADTQALSTVEHGAYLLLIGAYWTGGRPLPDDDVKLARIVHATPREWAAIRPALVEFFVIEGGEWRHNRIDRELSNAVSVYERRQAASRKANAVRYGSESEAETVSARPPQPQPQPQSTANAVDVGAAAPRQSKGARLPADWELPQDWYEWACHAWPHAAMGDVAQQADIFRDYWTAQPGQKGVKTDWPATWRNWIRRCANGGNHGVSRQYRKSGFDVVLDEIRAGAERKMAVDPD